MSNEHNGGRVILVVEDERPLQTAIKTKLEQAGFETTSARSVDQALGYLEDLENIDVIWLDHYLLGKKSGLDLVVELKKADSKWRSIPIFVVSNTASNDKVQTYLQLGIEKYYTKAEHRLEGIVDDMRRLLEQPE